MVLIQLLLPARVRGMGDTAAALSQTRQELSETFDGLTAYLRSPAKGVWTAPDGHVEEDDVVMVEVVTSRFDAAWWRAYATTLALRFRQDTIHVRALSIRVPDESA